MRAFRSLMVRPIPAIALVVALMACGPEAEAPPPAATAAPGRAPVATPAGGASRGDADADANGRANRRPPSQRDPGAHAYGQANRGGHAHGYRDRNA